jgi:HD-GYP domain-containing protein (c-di-GMP phosphodiesterase class II)
MASSTFTIDEVDNPLRGYLPVNVEMLRRMRVAAVDVFVQRDARRAPTLYCRAGLPLENQQLFGLGEAGIQEVFVRTSECHDFGAHLLETVDSLLKHEAIPATERFAALQLAMATEIEHAVRLIDCSKFVALSGKVGREIATLVASSNMLPHEMFRIARHDFNTFTHVTNVAGYSVLLAQLLGIRNKQELEEIAVAAMLHDVGKRFIPNSILMKPGRLDPAERQIIETHPTRGYEDLCDRPELNFAQLMMVYQHHERIDGGGYPVGIIGDEIHPWAKLLAVVDVFEAMTGKRPYRRPLSVHDAIKYIERSAGTQFEPEIVRCWVSAMKHV